MVATIAAVGLGSQLAAEAASTATDASTSSTDKDDDEDDPERFAFHDMTQPVEVIAKRLLAYNAHLEASPEQREERQARLLHASFVVEFGLEHGLPEYRDETSEALLKDFLQRLGEWEGGRD